MEGSDAVAVACDVTDAEQVGSVFARVQRDFGRLDLLFNNAGIAAKGAMVDEIPVEVWQQVVNVNLTGSFLCARAAFGLMRRQNPRGGVSSTTAPFRRKCRVPVLPPTLLPSTLSRD